MSGFFGSIWDSILIPREVHALLKFKLSAPTIDTTLTILDAAEVLQDADYVYLCLAKIAPSISTILLNLTADIRDSTCIYYIFIRTLDIIIEDPDLSVDRKIDLLTNFPSLLLQNGWKLDGIGATDNSRQLLSTYYKVSNFYQKYIPQKYQQVLMVHLHKTIALHCQILRAAQSVSSTTTSTHLSTIPSSKQIQSKLHTIKTINQYTQRALLLNGLLFECFDSLFLTSGLMLHQLADSSLSTPLASSTGIFIQKTTIILNYRRDLFTARCLWPEDIWGLYSQDLDFFVKYTTHIRSRLCLNQMILDAIKHGLDAIKYLSLIQHHQPTFTFVAMQVITAFTLLSEMYNNTQVFAQDIKPRTGLLCDVALHCTSYPIAKGYIYDTLALIEQKGLDPELDPTFLNPSIIQDEINMAIALYHEFNRHVQSCKEACLGFDPIVSGWATVAKLIGMGAAGLVVFKWLTDRGPIMDPYEIAVHAQASAQRGRKIPFFDPRGKEPPIHGYSYQRPSTEIYYDEHIPEELRSSKLSNLMNREQTRRSQQSRYTSLGKKSATDGFDLDDDVWSPNQRIQMQQAESFLNRLEGGENISGDELNQHLVALQRMIDDESLDERQLGEIFDNVQSTDSTGSMEYRLQELPPKYGIHAHGNIYNDLNDDEYYDALDLHEAEASPFKENLQDDPMQKYIFGFHGAPDDIGGVMSDDDKFLEEMGKYL